MSTVEFSLAGRTVISYLKDVDEQIERLEAADNVYKQERDGHALMSRGDLKLARDHIAEADADEQNILRARCYVREGQIRRIIAFGHGRFAAVPDEKASMRKCLGESAQAFAKAIEQDPQPNYYYGFGLTCASLGRDWEAVKAFEIAAQGDDPEIAMEARKEIGRIGPVSPPKTAAMEPFGTVGVSSFGTKKVINWGLVKNGGITAVVGFLLSAVGIVGLGVPATVVGIGIIVFGVAHGKQTY